ncbi:hypothetical protein [Haladaptatus sp. DYF46]|uniref:hypothetical protein n=1 Tax=Haladaptatus sp. DYF46 TaxID=2886041 RepID=UPI001E4FA207|nr:hypothetical protein [Haladaptatus sp. DYF46]
MSSANEVLENRRFSGCDERKAFVTGSEVARPRNEVSRNVFRCFWSRFFEGEAESGAVHAGFCLRPPKKVELAR